MKTRYTKSLLSIAAVLSLTVPALAQARNGSDDPATHVRREHHGRVHHVRHRAGDAAKHARRGSDDGPNHR